jgi:hypothetical protein
LPQQIKRLGRQHDVAVFASLGLHDADDVLRAVDIANSEPDHLARVFTVNGWPQEMTLGALLIDGRMAGAPFGWNKYAGI